MTISNIGLCVQTAGIYILFLLFVILSRHDKRLYVKYWTVSWLLYGAGLTMLLFSFLDNRRWTLAVYQLLELGSVAMVTMAGLNFAKHFRFQRKHVLLFIPAAAWSIVSTWSYPDFNGLYAFHSFLMATAFALNAYVFFSSQWFRHNLGTRMLAWICLLISVMQYHYVVVFGYAYKQSLGSIGYLSYTSFYDLIMQYVLAIGMVVMGMQENQHSLELSNTQLREAQRRLSYLAQTDPLTGVCNRHAFREVCEREFGSDQVTQVAHSLVIIDINHLKQINDLVGHSVGDEVLQNVAKTVNSAIRMNDFLVRWGGDEFLLLMRETGLTQAEERMAMLSEQLSGQSVRSQAGRVYLDISYGVAPFISTETLTSSIEEADRRMYAHKQISRKSLKLV